MELDAELNAQTEVADFESKNEILVSFDFCKFTFIIITKSMGRLFYFMPDISIHCYDYLGSAAFTIIEIAFYR